MAGTVLPPLLPTVFVVSIGISERSVKLLDCYIFVMYNIALSLTWFLLADFKRSESPAPIQVGFLQLVRLKRPSLTRQVSNLIQMINFNGVNKKLIISNI